ncbi:heme/hemin ABC transporter substrate-binding protein [Cellulomonas sp.]|uniref:heme/hemin ABC transporter substrate-binding protein n=1 Tax=Cellulomonas sp. TaxID=40001 RepID=UPI002D51D4C3|nr:ABC transporter substrate-binding protein [Cellulomonas sp.]HYQ76579.1 ABC transporter substrate-binding protein [Cellulomonas sp.]
MPARPYAPHRRAARRSVPALVAAVVVAVLAGCTGVAGAAGTGAAVAGDRPALADVTPVDDPRGWTGEQTAVAAATPVDPVAEDPRPALPVTLTDAQGTEVTVTDTSRVLALDLYGSTSRILFELGLGGSVVGRDSSSDFPEIADLPVVTTSGHDLSGEAILELAPTLILTDTTLGPWDTVLQMRDAGIPVVVVDSHRELGTVGDLITSVAAAVGLPDEGAALAERTEAEIADVRAQVDRLAPEDPADRLRVVFLYLRGQAGVYYLFGEGSGADSLIEALGAVDVAGEIGWQGMRPVTDEGLVAAQPDLVLVMTKGLESVGGVDGLLEQLPAVAQTPAGEHRRIVDMADTQVLSFGPTSAQTLDALARAFYAPDAS